MNAKYVLTGLWISFIFNVNAQSMDTWTVFNEDGSFELPQETRRLLSDAVYRNEVYPETYLLMQIPELLDENKVMFALWTLINTYPDQATQSSTIARMLVQKGVRGQHYLHAFYTYVFTDPQIFHFKEGEQPYMANPMLLEKKLETCKRLIMYTEEYLKAVSPAE